VGIREEHPLLSPNVACSYTCEPVIRQKFHIHNIYINVKQAMIVGKQWVKSLGMHRWAFEASTGEGSEQQ